MEKKNTGEKYSFQLCTTRLNNFSAAIANKTVLFDLFSNIYNMCSIKFRRRSFVCPLLDMVASICNTVTLLVLSALFYIVFYSLLSRCRFICLHLRIRAAYSIVYIFIFCSTWVWVSNVGIQYTST